MKVLLPVGISWVMNPMDEITSTAPAGACSWNTPSALVIAPVELPLICTDTMGTGCWSGPVTLPETGLTCAARWKEQHRSRKVKR